MWTAPALPLLYVLVLTILPQAGGNAGKTVLDRVYSHAQVEKGEKLYESNCVRCHEGNDPDGPTLVGRTFVDRWREDNLDVLFTYMKSRMPADAAGHLSDGEYLDILTFLLEANGYPGGSQELTLESLPGILIVGRDGPKPLPPNTLVQVVGCLVQGLNTTWSLTQATAPSRSRQGKETTEAELKKSGSIPLGTRTFTLQNFANVRFDFKPDPLKGHKVLVKGVLLRDSAGERISLTAMETLSPTCEPQ